MECTMTLDPSLCPDAELRTDGTFAGMYLPRPAANGDVHLIWKLKGTGKQNRLETIASCTKAMEASAIRFPSIPPGR